MNKGKVALTFTLGRVCLHVKRDSSPLWATIALVVFWLACAATPVGSGEGEIPHPGLTHGPWNTQIWRYYHMVSRVIQTISNEWIQYRLERPYTREAMWWYFLSHWYILLTHCSSWKIHVCTINLWKNVKRKLEAMLDMGRQPIWYSHVTPHISRWPWYMFLCSVPHVYIFMYQCDKTKYKTNGDPSETVYICIIYCITY
jgi:hypothetical protein